MNYLNSNSSQSNLHDLHRNASSGWMKGVFGFNELRKSTFANKSYGLVPINIYIKRNDVRKKKLK